MDTDYREAMKLANPLCFPLYAAARHVTGLYTPWLKPLGLTYTQSIDPARERRKVVSPFMIMRDAANCRERAAGRMRLLLRPKSITL